MDAIYTGIISRKNCLAQDEANDDLHSIKRTLALQNVCGNFSAILFIVTELIMSCIGLCLVDPHWFSTFFGWYVFASFFVSGNYLYCLWLLPLYLKSKGVLEHVNTSHIHDLSKFIFGFSVFWAYLWFSQYMLIWYSNIPGRSYSLHYQN